MKSITSKTKVWVILTLVVLIAGMALLGFLGLNASSDSSKCFEITVGVDQDVNGSADVVKASAESYFKSKNLSVVNGKVQVIDDGLGKVFVYKFNSETSVNQADLTATLQTALSGNERTAIYNASSEVSVVRANLSESNTGKVLIALAVSTVVLFIYLLFASKIVNALTVSCCSVVSALLFVSLVSVARIPVNATFGLFIACAFILGAVLSVVIVNRFKETSKTVGNEKLSAKEIADKGASQSLVRILFFAFALIVASAVLLIAGATYLKFIGLTLIAVDVASVYSSLVLTPVIWSALKSNKKA